MIIVLSKNVSQKEEEFIFSKIQELGLRKKILEGIQGNLIEVVEAGNEAGNGAGNVDKKLFEGLPGVDSVVLQSPPYKLAGRVKDLDSRELVLSSDGVSVGGKKLLIIAGPCTVETEEQTIRTAEIVKRAGANLFRGGAYKPRSSPYSFQGHKELGLKILDMAREETGLLICTEVMDTRDVELVCKYADVLQIGTRNMQNFSLLMEVGKVGKPVLLKRGWAASVEEWLMSAEYIMSCGNEKVILCERGVRTFGTEPMMRNTLDIKAVLIAQELSCLPVIIDPSHAAVDRRFVSGLSRAGISAGADGLLIEVHNDPSHAIVDGFQAIGENELIGLMKELDGIAGIVGRKMPFGS